MTHANLRITSTLEVNSGAILLINLFFLRFLNLLNEVVSSKQGTSCQTLSPANTKDFFPISVRNFGCTVELFCLAACLVLCACDSEVKRCLFSVW